MSAIPIENQLKEQARDVIDSLRKDGFGEIEVYDMEFNSMERESNFPFETLNKLSIS